MKTASRSFENVAQLKYLGMAETNQNLIQEEIEKRLNSGRACYHSVQNLLSSCLLPKNVKIRICKTVILPVILYGCETWSLTLEKEHRLRLFESRVLRRIYGPKKDEVIGCWRKLHNEELQNLCSSPSIIRMIKPRRMRLAGYVAHMRAKRNTCWILVGKPEGKKPVGRPGHGWEDNIKMGLGEIAWDGMDWIDLAQGRVP
jgi:hypothetical protein